jgi:tRNA-specific 2-thiouridylase
MTIIAVAVSGGVDSLVAAHLLKQQGHEVTGIYFRTGYEKDPARPTPDSPLTDDIRAIGRQLNIPIEILDLSSLFRETVVAYFSAAYRRGRTPNPCLYCNPTIKFGHLLSHVRRGGAQALATGHYARLQTGADQRAHLLRGIDSRKDQSYFLSRLTQEQLAAARFPLGALTKDAVRAIARRHHLSPVTHAESQDICFIRGMAYPAFLQQQNDFQPREGLIEDTEGNVIGRHRGLHLFTIGQRRGINCPAEEPYYVIRMDHDRNRLVVGQRGALARDRCVVENINWINRPARFPAALQVQIRYRHRAAPARVTAISSTRADIQFESPQDAVTPGQGAVFYRNDEVLGGGWIA